MDTEADGATGGFRWPAAIAKRWFSTYRNLGVTAFYINEDGRTIHVACTLGKPSTPTAEGLRADLLSLEPIHQLEAYSRTCKTFHECDSSDVGSSVASIPGRDRNGAFAMNISFKIPAAYEYYSLRFAAIQTNAEAIATSIVVRAAPAGVPR